MPPSLREYERKRDLSATPEPAGDAAPPAGERQRFEVLEYSTNRYQ